MKPHRLLLPLLALAGSLVALAALAQTSHPFSSGSTGELGDLLVDESVLISLPPDGVFHYRRVEISESGTVQFIRNARNTPVTLLAQEEVIIAGNILLDGTAPSGGDPGRGGPGGFDGGRGASGGLSGGLSGGAGKGPGGGRPGVGHEAGPGAYATRGDANGGRQITAGSVYGAPLLLPVVGGSGGGGLNNGFVGGGGGGGAILIASDVQIHLPLQSKGVFARGGEVGGNFNNGSGGAIRLVAPIVSGVGTLNVQSRIYGGIGRVRIDSPNASQANLAVTGSYTVGTLMLTRLPLEPQLNILRIGDQDVPQDQEGVVTVVFPNGAPTQRPVQVEARDFGTVVPIRLVLTPDHGVPVIVDTEIDNSTPSAAALEIPVNFPLNVVVSVAVWTR